jgi:hypothetical protein
MTYATTLLDHQPTQRKQVGTYEEQWDNVPMAAALKTFQNPSGRSAISSP